jgi:hypothetical protein
VIAESCGKPLEVVNPSSEVFAHCFPVAIRYAERGCPAVSPATIDADYASVRDGYQPGPLEVQQLGPFGTADVAAPDEAVLLVKGCSCLVEVTAGLAMFQPGSCGNGRKLGGCVDIHESRDIVGAQACVYDDKAADIAKGDFIDWVGGASGTRPPVRVTCKIIKTHGVRVIDGVVLQELNRLVQVEVTIPDSHG